jgi:hypothetical protein
MRHHELSWVEVEVVEERTPLREFAVYFVYERQFYVQLNPANESKPFKFAVDCKPCNANYICCVLVYKTRSSSFIGLQDRLALMQAMI